MKVLNIRLVGRVLGVIVHIAVKTNIMIDTDKKIGHNWNTSNHFNKSYYPNANDCNSGRN